MIDKLRQDSFWMGLILGFLIPAILFGLLELILSLLPREIKIANVFTLQRLVLLSIIPNVLFLRYYLLKLKYDLTGRGILTITFVIGIFFAILHFLPTH
jgi:hypothetical protein